VPTEILSLAWLVVAAQVSACLLVAVASLAILWRSRGHHPWVSAVGMVAVTPLATVGYEFVAPRTLETWLFGLAAASSLAALPLRCRASDVQPSPKPDAPCGLDCSGNCR
jgi:hypothetical protein